MCIKKYYMIQRINFYKAILVKKIYSIFRRLGCCLLKHVSSRNIIYDFAILITRFANKMTYNLVYQYIDKYLGTLRYGKFDVISRAKSDFYGNVIWVCWLQGQKHMPKLIRICYQQLLRNANGYKVILLTEKNISDYLTIDDSLKNRIGKEISFTAYSDLLRLNLLAFYGGVWIDSTYLLTSPLPDDFFSRSFYTLHKLQSCERQKTLAFVSEGRWTGNLIGCRPNYEPMMEIRNIFLGYWLLHNQIIDFFLIDHVINYVYNTNEFFKKDIDNIPITNSHSLALDDAWGEKWNETIWNHWVSDTCAFKLSRKHIVPEFVNERLTNCGYVYHKYGKNIS